MPARPAAPTNVRQQHQGAHARPPSWVRQQGVCADRAVPACVSRQGRALLHVDEVAVKDEDAGREPNVKAMFKEGDAITVRARLPPCCRRPI